MTREFRLDVTFDWGSLREVRRLVGEVLAEYPEDVREAAVMTASELTENALKYGIGVPEMPRASLSFAIDSEQLTIAVANGVGPQESIESLTGHIDAICESRDTEALYLERLKRLMDAPSEGGGGRLGLLRVAFEGCFKIGYEYQAPILTITARRVLS